MGVLLLAILALAALLRIRRSEPGQRALPAPRRRAGCIW